jgi:hypothetical protein
LNDKTHLGGDFGDVGEDDKNLGVVGDKAYISSVESLCTVDSSSNLRLLLWLDIGIVSTLLRFHSIVGRVHTLGSIPEWISHPL